MPVGAVVHHLQKVSIAVNLIGTEMCVNVGYPIPGNFEINIMDKRLGPVLPLPRLKSRANIRQHRVIMGHLFALAYGVHLKFLCSSRTWRFDAGLQRHGFSENTACSRARPQVHPIITKTSVEVPADRIHQSYRSKSIPITREMGIQPPSGGIDLPRLDKPAVQRVQPME